MKVVALVLALAVSCACASRTPASTPSPTPSTEAKVWKGILEGVALFEMYAALDDRVPTISEGYWQASKDRLWADLAVTGGLFLLWAHWVLDWFK